MQMSYGPGVHILTEPLIFNSVWDELEGAGKWHTILKCPAGVVCSYSNPRIRGVTIEGNGNGIGLYLQNTWSARIEDVSIENFATGIILEVNEAGRTRTPSGVTQPKWPYGSVSNPWGSRVTLTTFRDVDLIGPGAGYVLRNLLPSGNSGLGGEFFTATHIDRGHIVVPGAAIAVGDYVWNTTIAHVYIDMGIGSGVVLEPQAWDVHLLDCHIDKTFAARQVNTPKMIAKSSRAYNSIRLTSCMETTLADVLLVA